VAVDSAANIYIADVGHNVVRVVNPTANATTIAGVMIDAGDIETVAGNFSAAYGYVFPSSPQATEASLNAPHAVAVDAAGNIYIADYANNVVGFVSSSTGLISTLAGYCASPCTGG
jgi:trimeric autotransporter adhesin